MKPTPENTLGLAATTPMDPNGISPPSPTARADLRGQILFAGGCHVNGYPVGEDSSFSELTAQALGFGCLRIGPIGLANTTRLFEYLNNNPRPEIAVLQFGNYEVPRPLAKHARAVFDAAFAGIHVPHLSHSTSKRPWLSFPPEHVFTPTPSWRSRVLLKQAYATLAQHLHPPLFDANAVRLSLRTLLTQLATFNIPRTVVLSPLPCADHMARSFRIAAAPIFREESAAAGLLYLDTASALGYRARRTRRSFEIYADERHLNLDGHLLLAHALTDILHPLLPPQTQAPIAEQDLTAK